MTLALATAAVLMVQPGPPPVSFDFDLSPSAARAVPRDRQAPATAIVPRNLDTRGLVDMPEVELSLADNGPVLLVGAMGGRQGAKYGSMPALAHVAVGWTF
jgi:hypothetical protein